MSDGEANANSNPKRVAGALAGWETRRANGKGRMSDETRRKLSEALTGRRLTKKHRAAVGRGVRRYWALRERP